MDEDTDREISPRCRSCCWKREFAKRRHFNPNHENETLLKLPQDTFGQIGDSNESDSGDGDEIKEGCHEQGTSDGEDPDDRLNDGNVVGAFLREEDDSLHYLDLYEELEGFCRDTSLRGLLDGTPENSEVPVAILYDMDGAGRYRPYTGPLTQKQLYEGLRRKRFIVGSSETTRDSEIKDEEDVTEPDAEKRLVYITNLDRWSILTLFATASLSQAPVLVDLVYKHLTSQASIGVTFRPSGFRTYTLDFHIPYFTLRKRDIMFEDSRKKSDGSPLRQVWDLPSARVSTEPAPGPNELERLYLTQVSFVVTGFDHWIWLAYALVDIAEPRDAVQHYHQETEDSGLFVDPLAAGRLPIESKYIPTPREYFLRVFRIRIQKVKSEWHYILRRLQKEILHTRQNAFFSWSSGKFKDEDDTRKQVRNLSDWNTQTMFLVTELMNCLSSTLSAWEKFQQSHARHFRHQCRASPTLLEMSLDDDVEKTFLELGDIRQELEKLKTGLRDDFSQALDRRFSVENNDATILQQRLAKFIGKITICFYPLVVSAGLFSTQPGVMPFAQNFLSFALSFLVFTFLVSLALNWDSWSQSVVKWLRLELLLQKSVLTCQESTSEGRGSGIYVLGRVGPATASNRGLFSFHRRSDQPTSLDPETGMRDS